MGFNILVLMRIPNNLSKVKIVHNVCRSTVVGTEVFGFAEMIVESCMTSHNLSGHSNVSSIHLDTLFSKLVPPKHVKGPWVRGRFSISCYFL